MPTTTKLTPAQMKKRDATQKRAKQAEEKEAAAWSQAKSQSQSDALAPLDPFFDMHRRGEQLRGLFIQDVKDGARIASPLELKEVTREEFTDSMQRMGIDMQNYLAANSSPQGAEDRRRLAQLQEAMEHQRSNQQQEPAKRPGYLLRVSTTNSQMRWESGIISIESELTYHRKIGR